MNKKIVFYMVGRLLTIEGILMLLPMLVSIVYLEKCWAAFLIAILAALGVGMLFTAVFGKNEEMMFAKEGFAIVAFAWIIMSLVGALPFYISREIPSFIDAFFETVSGFTTTGSSILTDVESMSRGLLFWRSFTHWIGGMGVLVFVMAIFPQESGRSIHIMRAEMPGPIVGKLVPKARDTAKILYLIYMVMTFVEIVLLICGGMPLFDSIVHSFGTAGTGGFGISNAGFSQYSSYSHIVITVFMILFGIDFSIYHLIIMRKFRSALKSDEVKTYLGIILAAIVILCFNCSHLYESLFDNVKHSAFQVASIITTTGYSTVDFNLWPELSKSILVLLMFFGACAGSTGGGIKISRVMIMFKSIIKEVRILAHPKSTLKIKMNGRAVEHETVRAVNVFMMAYIAIFATSLLIISLDNLDFTTNFTAVAATINNIGPGLGAVGPMANFSVYSPLSTFVLICNMLIGRLEIFPLLLLVSPYTWKK